MNAPKETGNLQRTLRTPSLGNTSTVQCYNYSGKGHYARNYLKPRVRDSKYFMEQMLLVKHNEAGVILTDEQNDFLFTDALRMEEIEELSANICLMARIQPADHTSDDGPSCESAFISKEQSSSIDENNEPIGSVEKDTHVYDLCALETLARNAYDEAAKQQRFAQKVQQQNETLTSQIEMIPKSSETTFVAPLWTRFYEKATQSKTIDTTYVASKSKIDKASASKARDKVSSEFKKKKSLGHNLFSVGQFCDGDLEVAFRSKTWFDSKSRRR
ncbi:hypothetical protein Tco_1271318 [Tanacetum coccineum]